MKQNHKNKKNIYVTLYFQKYLNKTTHIKILILFQASLDRVFSWNQGHCVPTHLPKSDEDEQNGKVKNEEEEETPEDPDADLLKRDIILVILKSLQLGNNSQYFYNKLDLMTENSEFSGHSYYSIPEK